MVAIGEMRNPIRNNAWGSRTAIAELRGEPSPSSEPQAEMWMGAHPSAPSEVRQGDRWVRLDELIREDPVGVLGEPVVERFGSELPFLFKLLAAAEPLSIQAHPDRAQARDGFERENAAGVALDAPERNYRDPNAKPELLCALTPFWALYGFRPAGDVARCLRDHCGDVLRDEADALEKAGDAGLRDFFASLFAMDAERVVRSVGWCARKGSDEAARWVAELADRHPGDPGALAPLFLHVLRLDPGQALFVDAGELHSYLEGVGVEIMANSDNVLRGGLTKRHVDVPELLRVLRSTAQPPTVVRAHRARDGSQRYETSPRDFALSELSVDADTTWISPSHRSVEILLAVEGSLSVRARDGGDSVPLPRGASVLVPARVVDYELSGSGRVFRAAVPVV